MKKMFFVASVLLCAASVSYANTCEEKCAADHENVLEVVKCIAEKCGGTNVRKFDGDSDTLNEIQNQGNTLKYAGQGSFFF